MWRRLRWLHHQRRRESADYALSVVPCIGGSTAWPIGRCPNQDVVRSKKQVRRENNQGRRKDEASQVARLAGRALRTTSCKTVRHWRRATHSTVSVCCCMKLTDVAVREKDCRCRWCCKPGDSCSCSVPQRDPMEPSATGCGRQKMLGAVRLSELQDIVEMLSSELCLITTNYCRMFSHRLKKLVLIGIRVGLGPYRAPATLRKDKQDTRRRQRRFTRKSEEEGEAESAPLAPLDELSSNSIAPAPQAAASKADRKGHRFLNDAWHRTGPVAKGG